MGNRVCVTHYLYESVKLPKEFDGYKIAALSDLHCNEIGMNNCVLINTIKSIKPDAIMIMGDMVSSNAKDLSIPLKLIENLINDYPIYYSCGNHELKLGINPITKKIYYDYRKKLRSLGVKYLNNKSVYITKGDSRINVSGVNISKKYYGRFWRKVIMPVNYIERLLGAADNKTINILLAHNPDYFQNYSDWGANIVLSGHIHGGIMILPVIGGVISPTLRLFPHYDFGQFNIEDSCMYLSRGLGAHTIPIRIFNQPEILALTLHTI